MSPSHINVVILEDHRSIIDGYLYRLEKAANIRVVGVVSYGEELQAVLKRHSAQLLLLDIQVPTSPNNSNPFPILPLIPELILEYPGLNILAMTMHTQPVLIESLIRCGVKGIIFKDDSESIKNLAKIAVNIAGGGAYFSPAADKIMRDVHAATTRPILSARQREALELCAAYPESATAELAGRLGIAESTFRNLLSQTYLRLGVRNRESAVLTARKNGLIASL